MPYSDIQALLRAKVWDYIKFIFNRSWSDACDEFRMSYFKNDMKTLDIFRIKRSYIFILKF